jgi:hypothetical protein
MLWYDPMTKVHGTFMASHFIFRAIKTTSISRYSMNTRQFSCEAGTAMVTKTPQYRIIAW